MTLLVISPDYASHLFPLATLATAWRDAGERGLYVTLSETTDELHAVAASHGWTLDGVEIFERDLVVSDRSPEEIRALRAWIQAKCSPTPAIGCGTRDTVPLPGALLATVWALPRPPIVHYP